MNKLNQLENDVKKRLPLISCLCVTNNRLQFLKRSINCFKNQSYLNKELVIVYIRGNQETKVYLENLNDPDISIHEILESDYSTLGAKRNISIEYSKGEYFCQWDDDDWHHPDRLKKQLDLLIKSQKDASILLYEVIYDSVNQQAYGSTMRPIEHSIMCRREIFTKGIRYSDKNKGEDFDFIALLLKSNLIFPIIDPSLYIYVYHGENTFEAEHFESMFNYSTKFSVSLSLIISNILREYLNNEGMKYLNTPEFLNAFNYFARFPFK